MAITQLVPDSDYGFKQSAPQTIRLAATTGVSASFGLPPNFDKVWVSVPTIASSTLDFKVSLGGSYRTVAYDLNGTGYPRATFTGNVTLGFLVPPAAVCSVSLAATGTGANLVVVAAE